VDLLLKLGVALFELGGTFTHALLELVMGAAQYLLGRASVGDVAQDHREHQPIRTAELGDRGFGRKLAAVAPTAVDLAALGHHPRGLRGGREIPHLTGVAGNETLGNEPVQGLADDVGGAVAEDPLGAPVEQGDGLGFVDGDDRVVGAGEDLVKRGSVARAARARRRAGAG
jgi:hypothetical protein